MRMAFIASSLLVAGGFGAGYALLGSKSTPRRAPVVDSASIGSKPETARLFTPSAPKTDEIATILVADKPPVATPVSAKPNPAIVKPVAKPDEKTKKPKAAAAPPVKGHGSKPPASVFLDVPSDARPAKRL